MYDYYGWLFCMIIMYAYYGWLFAGKMVVFYWRNHDVPLQNGAFSHCEMMTYMDICGFRCHFWSAAHSTFGTVSSFVIHHPHCFSSPLSPQLLVVSVRGWSTLPAQSVSLRGDSLCLLCHALPLIYSDLPWSMLVSSDLLWSPLICSGLLCRGLLWSSPTDSGLFPTDAGLFHTAYCALSWTDPTPPSPRSTQTTNVCFRMIWPILGWFWSYFCTDSESHCDACCKRLKPEPLFLTDSGLFLTDSGLFWRVVDWLWPISNRLWSILCWIGTTFVRVRGEALHDPGLSCSRLQTAAVRAVKGRPVPRFVHNKLFHCCFLLIFNNISCFILILCSKWSVWPLILLFCRHGGLCRRLPGAFSY